MKYFKPFKVALEKGPKISVWIIFRRFDLRSPCILVLVNYLLKHSTQLSDYHVEAKEYFLSRVYLSFHAEYDMILYAIIIRWQWITIFRFRKKYITLNLTCTNHHLTHQSQQYETQTLSEITHYQTNKSNRVYQV